MQHTPFAPDLPDAEPSPDDFSSNGAVPNHLQHQFSDATHHLVGPQIGRVQGYHSARHTVTGHLDVPQRGVTNVMSYDPKMHATMNVPSSVPSMNQSDSIHINPKELARGTAKAFAGGGAVGAAAAGATALTLGGSQALGLAATAALPVAWQGAVAAGSTYLGGVLHNAVWHRPGGKKPGFWGTLARGVISPVSVPLGIGVNLFRKSK